MARKCVIIDVGTGYTKLGFGGNLLPTAVFPTQVHNRIVKSDQSAMSTVDFYVGQDTNVYYESRSPLDKGVVTDWELMEQLWAASFYEILKYDPTDSSIILTETPFNPPEAREVSAEIMFETFNVGSLYIGVQALFSLVANFENTREDIDPLTGTVIDSGDGLTHIIPLIHGYVHEKSIKSIPVAGKNVTRYLQGLIREREPNFPKDDGYKVARYIKENYSYISDNPISELANPVSNYVKPFEYNGVSFELGYEQFLAPEILFIPGIGDFSHPSIQKTLYESIQSCPIDSRKLLYDNILLSGGNTTTKNFAKRLQNELDTILLKNSRNMSKSTVNYCKYPTLAVWHGASMLSNMNIINQMLISKEIYNEMGSGIFRENRVLKSI